LAFTTKLKYDGVEVAIGYGVVTDLNPDSKYGTNEIGEFISNFILNKDDLMYNSGNVTIGQSTIFLKKTRCF
jgi:3-isopropylmalate dehydrogenase